MDVQKLLLCLVSLIAPFGLAGCQAMISLPPLPTPTATVSPLPTPTPTRADEVVISFETLAINDLVPLLPPAVGEPEIVTNFTFSPSSNEEIGKFLEPMVFLVTSLEDITPFQEWLPSETITAITNVEFEQYVVIAFFAGLKGGGSDGFVERIAASQDRTVIVYAVLRSFGSGPAVETFPSQIVMIQRQDVPFPLSGDTQIILETHKEHAGPQVTE